MQKSVHFRKVATEQSRLASLSAIESTPSELGATNGVPYARGVLHEVFLVLTRQPRRVPATELRQHFSDAVEWVSETHRPLIVTNHGRQEAVVLSAEAFEQLTKGVARAVLALGANQTSLSQQAEDVLEDDGAARAKRFRQGGAD